MKSGAVTTPERFFTGGTPEKMLHIIFASGHWHFSCLVIIVRAGIVTQLKKEHV